MYQVRQFLNKESTEQDTIMFYPKSVFRATRNIEGLQQGQLCVIEYESLEENSIAVFVAPNLESLSAEVLGNETYRTWPRIVVRKSPGYVHVWKSSKSARRVQFPLSKYVALTIHKLMGDTFLHLAAAISANNPELGIWLISQLYVIVSRVKHLDQLYFVGPKDDMIQAVRNVLKKRNMKEERLFEMFKSMKYAAKVTHGPQQVTAPPFLKRHFAVPKTTNGFVYVLLSMKDPFCRTIHIAQTSLSLSEELRTINSTEVCQDSHLYANQPWAIAFFYFNFLDVNDRLNVFEALKVLERGYDCCSFEKLLNDCSFQMRNKKHVKLVVCGNITHTIDTL